MKKLITLFLTLVFTLSILSVFGQGVTTASLKGKVFDKNGDPLNGFVVIQAINQSNNSEYVTMTFADGNYRLQGLQVGGPYKIIAVLTGYKTQEKDNIFLQLNQEATINFTLVTDEQEIEEVVVTVDALEANKTGAVTSIGIKQIEMMPTISRSQNDMTRLNPLANGTSFGGRNKLYNNFSLDGSVFNNSFGLDDATPGGQSDAQPVSMDALEQIQVSLAPFDVREGGFSGAGINAVTKSGTNDLKASLYYYTRNENMIGSKVGDLEVENTDFKTMLTGFTVGGPIIKDKLFFFLSAEAERIEGLAHGFVADNGTNSGANVTSVLESDIKAVQQHLINEWGYDPGAYQGYNHKTASDKILAKLNWNINKKHKFTIRYNMLEAYKDHTPHPEAIIGRGPTSYRLPFENSSYRINNNIYSIVSELNSRFNNKLFNKVLVGYTAFRDFREPKSKPFPVIDIFDANGNLAITAGMEMFSTNNVLDQDVYQFNDNLTYYADKHTITGGVNFEMFQFNNSFNLFYYPWHMYGSVNDFLNTTVADVDYNAEVTAAQTKEFAMAEVDVAQLAFYVQDEFEVSNNFNLTAGLRVDMPLYFNQIKPDDGIRNYKGWKDTDGNDVTVDPSKWPSSNLMWSPRVGFNWSVMNNLKVRGGTGVFTGRIPFVWLGNQSTNSNIDPGYEFQVNTTEEGFKYPQVWKNDLALDIIAGQGWFFTLEGIYGKDINAVVHRNYNMLKPTGKLSGADDRAIFAGFNESNIYSADASTTTFLDAGVIVMENVDEGYQGSITAQVKKNFNFGVNLFAAYSYLESKDYTSIPAEIAADAFGRNPVVGDPNQSMFSYSRYGLKHRFITSASYQIEFKKNFATSIGLFYELGKGNRYSYIYAGDLNQDGIGFNDLLYVPANSSEIHFGTVDGTGVATEATDAAAQWTTLEAFINQDEYLSTRKGDYAERNGAMLPWFSQLDLSLAQDFSINVKGKKNTLRLSVDILNFGNLVNSNWGVRKIVATNAPIALSGIDSNSVPYFSVSPDLKTTFIDDTSIASKWQIQFGIRYIFN